MWARDLAGQHHVLAGLGHRSLAGGDDEDGSVDLGGAGDHVLHVVGVLGVLGHVEERAWDLVS